MNGGFQLGAFAKAFQQVVVGSLNVFFGGGFFPKRRREELKPIEAVEIVREQGNPQERERAAEIEAEALVSRLVRAKRLLNDAEKRAARAQGKWAVSVAERIERERDDEELALFALLVD